MTKLKIGIITAIDYLNNQPIGGILTYLKNILPKLDGDVYLIGYSSNRDEIKKKIKLDFCTIYNLFYYDFYHSKLPLRLVSVVRYFFNSLKISKLDLDILYFHSDETPLSFLFFSKAKRKFVLHTHGSHLATEISRFQYARNPLFNFIWRLIQRVAYSKVHKIVAINSEIQKYLIDINLGAKSILIPNCIDEKRFFCYNTDLRIQTRNNLRFSSEKKYLLYAGRIERSKNIKIIINVLKKLVEMSTIEFNCIIIGEGSEKKQLQFLSKSAGLTQKIQWIPPCPQKQLIDYYNACDIFLLPSAREGFSMAILEAIACGLPVIATDVGANKEIIQDGVNGFVVSNNKNLTETIISKILEVFSDRPIFTRSDLPTSIPQFYSSNVQKIVNTMLHDLYFS